jgi:SAM-dependent methyltransferase
VSRWEDVYRKAECAWGERPDWILEAYIDIIPKGEALDIGIGEGRNALFLALRGFDVTGYDISETAVNRCLQRAKSLGINVKALTLDIRQIEIPKDRYALIVCAWTLNFFKKSECEKILANIRDGVKRDGFVSIGVFSTEDPGYERLRSFAAPIEENTFYSPKLCTYVHYFTEQELLNHFQDYQTIACIKGKILDIEHRAKPHYHGVIYYLGQKTKNSQKTFTYMSL